MISRIITNCTLEGPIYKAFKAFCDKNGCLTSTEGIRTLIRETDEYRRIMDEESGPFEKLIRGGK